MVLRSATSSRGTLKGVGPENRDFFGPWNGTSEASAIWAQSMYSICLHVAFLLLVSSSVFFSLDCVAVHVFFHSQHIHAFVQCQGKRIKLVSRDRLPSHECCTVAPLGGTLFGHQLHICSVFFCYFSLISRCFTANAIITLTDNLPWLFQWFIGWLRIGWCS